MIMSILAFVGKEVPISDPRRNIPEHHKPRRRACASCLKVNLTTIKFPFTRSVARLDKLIHEETDYQGMSLQVVLLII